VDKVDDGRGGGGGKGAVKLELSAERRDRRLREEAGCRDCIYEELLADLLVRLVVAYLTVSAGMSVRRGGRICDGEDVP
jgi:hypothetical protein